MDVEEPPSVQQKEVTSDNNRQPDKPTIRDLFGLLVRRRGLLATGMVIAVTDKFSSIKHVSLV